MAGAPEHVEEVRRNFIDLLPRLSSTYSPPSMNESCTTWPKTTTPELKTSSHRS